MDSAQGFFDHFPFPIPWIVSAALALGAGAVVLLPSAVGMTHLITHGSQPPPTHFDAIWEAIWLVALILIAGYVLEALSNPMWEILEGYRLWPRWAKSWRRARHISKRNKLEKEYEKELKELSESSSSHVAFQLQFLERRVADYPDGDRRIAPTRLGNVTRAMETWGSVHYNLDSQRLWHELVTVAPAPLQLELIRLRQSADFFVGTVFTSSAFAIAAIVTGTLENVTGYSGRPNVLRFPVVPAWKIWIGPLYTGMPTTAVALGTFHIAVGALVLLLVPMFCYRRSIERVRTWTRGMRALVNIGRIELARQLDLAIPASYDEERRMWGSLGQFVANRNQTRVEYWGRYFDTLDTKLNSGATRAPENHTDLPEGGPGDGSGG